MANLPNDGGCLYGPDDPIEYAYEEMEPGRAEAFGRHLAQCPACARQVQELAGFAGLTRRICAQPDPKIDWQRSPPAPKERPGRGLPSGWWRWTPVAGLSAAAALLVLLLALPGQDPTPAAPQAAPATESAPVVQTAVALELLGTFDAPVRFQRPGESAADAQPGPHRLQAGDRVEAGDAAATWSTPGGDRLGLAPGTRLRLVALGEHKERWELERGTLTCQVARRAQAGAFSVQAGPGQVTVKGTRFALRFEPGEGLQVAVESGLVELAPLDGGPAVDLGPGQQARLEPAGSVQIAAADPELAALLVLPLPAEAASNRPAPRSRPERAAPPSGPAVERTVPDPVADAPGPDPSATPEPLAAPADPAPPARLTAEFLAESLAANTAWMFDGIRSDLTSGRAADALRKLHNYLGDPQSPDRDEATYLLALSQELLDQRDRARQTFQLYLERWPTGVRAAEARAGLLRLR